MIKYRCVISLCMKRSTLDGNLDSIFPTEAALKRTFNENGVRRTKLEDESTFGKFS